MNKEITSKLWVTKFCLKIIHPKFNYYIFLIFLAIKFRIYNQRKKTTGENMDTYKIKVIPSQIQENIISNYVEDNKQVIGNKCIIISREEFIQLSSQNLFYLDNGVVWLAMKLSPEVKKKHKEKALANKETKRLTFSIHYPTLEINKKQINGTGDLDNVRLVPVVGSKQVKNNVALTNENELYNIATSFGLQNDSDVKVTFHAVPALEFAPKIAATAEVNLIVNDYDLSNDFLKEILSNHFCIPKLISLGDLFCIELTPEITDKYQYKYLDLIQSTGKLYFKCKKLTSDKNTSIETDAKLTNVIQPFFIVKGVTQLNLGENIHCVKPRDQYFTNDSKKLNLLHSCPTGLKEKFNQLQETISPFLTEEISDLSTHMSSPIIPMLLLTGSSGSGRHLLVNTLAKLNGLNCLHIDCNALQSSTAKQTESKINSMIQKAKAAAPVITLLDNFDVFAVDPENNEDCRVMEYFMNAINDLYQNYTKHAIIFIALSEKQDLKPNVLRTFIDKFHIPRLSLQQRQDTLQWFTGVMGLKVDGLDCNSTKQVLDNDVNITKHTKDVLQRVAAKTETFVYGDIDTLLHFAIRESYLKQQNSCLLTDPDLSLVKEDDFNTALEAIRKLQSQNLDTPKIPKVYWEDIGGLEKLKKELMKTIEFPIKYPHLFKNSSLKRSGILLYGPPGCGKTLVAKAVSTELNISFLSVKGPELLNMYIGQSEENVRKVFESARASSPCVVFLDELDALAPRRGAAGDSAGASDRVVSQLLAELDAVSTTEEADSTSFVFIMGATNRPDLLEQSLLRPGRLDKLIYVGPYDGLEEKTCVLKALCRSYKLRAEVRLEAVAAALPARCTGADLLHVVASARAAAVRGLVAKLHTGAVKESELSVDSVVIGVSELYEGVKTFRPSVTDEELAYYESLKSQM